MKLRLHVEARGDIDAAATWYDEQEPGLGDEFLAEVDRHIAGLLLQFAIWPVWPCTRARKHPVQRRLMNRFPYGIAYQVIGELIVVVAVAADKQRPRFWAARLTR